MESQLQQNTYNLVNARNTEASNILSLKQLLQLSPDADFSINYQDFSDEDVLSIIPSVADAELMALNNLPDVKAAELQTKAAELQTKIAKAGYMPSISLNGGVSSSNGNVYKSDFGTQIKDHLRENIGVSISVPILDNRRTRSAIDRAKIQQSNALLNQENTLLKLQNTIASLHLDILSAQSRYQSAIASEASAKESFEMMEERYNVGLESVIDLLTEKNNYLRAKQETLQSKYTALMDLELLDFYTGQ
jgi:outer membrane protein